MPATSGTSEFEDIVRRHWQRIFALILQFERDRDFARDLTQECFCNAWRGWRYYRGDASVQTWLSRIAVNVVRNHARRQRNGRWTQLDDASVLVESLRIQRSPEADFLMSERVEAVWSASGFASSQQQTALRLRFVNDLTTREIAEVMDITEGAVKAHLFRALHTVRGRLKKPAGTYT